MNTENTFLQKTSLQNTALQAPSLQKTSAFAMENVSKLYSIRKKWGKIFPFYAVNNVSLKIEKGTCLGLVGESGCGKSTLARMAVGLLPPTQGRIFLDGEEIFNPTSGITKGFPSRIQMIFQDPFSSLNPRMRIGKSIAEPLTNMSSHAIQEEVMKALRAVGLDENHYGRFPHEFSGGQRQRIALARAFISKPQVLICDEPVSALDASVQAHVLNLMRDIQAEQGISYLFISHDLHVVGNMSNEIIVMYFGSIVEKAKREDLLSHPLHPYTKMLMAAAPSLGQNFHKDFTSIQGEPPSPIAPPTGCAFHLRCPYKQSICQKNSPQLEEIAVEHFVACHFPR